MSSMDFILDSLTDFLTDAFLSAELQRLDLLLSREVLRLRAAYELSSDEYRGLYISDEQIDQLLAQREVPYSLQEFMDRAEAMASANRELLAENAPWLRMVAAFDLSPFEQEVLLMVLAPELDVKYETLYAYLNNDISRKFPTIDLALRLFVPTAASRGPYRKYLLPQASLFRHGLLEVMAANAERPHWLVRGLLPNPILLAFLLGDHEAGAAFDADFAPCVSFYQTALSWQQLSLLQEQAADLQQISRFLERDSTRQTPMLVFVGRAQAGQEDVAALLCQEAEIPLLRVDLAHARALGLSPTRLAATLTLYRRLWRAALYLEQSGALFGGEAGALPLPEARALIAALNAEGLPLFLAVPPDSAWQALVEGERYLAFPFDEPDFDQRVTLWRAELARAAITLEDQEIQRLANHFILTPGQVRAAITAAQDRHQLQAEPSSPVALSELVEAARRQSGHSLARLATKVSTMHTWSDLVLPHTTQRRIHEIAAAIRHQHIVYTQWGFAQRVSAGKGLKILFAGASGTGKTMTASVIAREVGLDLYKVDLSGVVSKYIGETEKNLEGIFRAAYNSNAILFFDEADALFGKRSEVKDAHDRYANIEVSYLLQRMEQHEGSVILASNLSKNIDDAFSRRMHYVVEFSLPDEEHRQRLWRGIFPAQAPLGADVDLPFLARHFVIAGGDIQNVALDAAFLAAQSGCEITMHHLVRAMARQMLKQGRTPSPSDFRQYFPILSQD